MLEENLDYIDEEGFEVINPIKIKRARLIENSGTYYPMGVFDGKGELVEKALLEQDEDIEVEILNTPRLYVLRTSKYKELRLCQDYGALTVDENGKVKRFAAGDGASEGLGSGDLANYLVLNFLESSSKNPRHVIQRIEEKLRSFSIPPDINRKITQYCRDRNYPALEFKMLLKAMTSPWAASTFIGGLIEDNKLKGILIGDGGLVVLSKRNEIKYIKMKGDRREVPYQIVAGNFLPLEDSMIEDFEIELEEGDIVILISDGLLKEYPIGQRIEAFTKRVLELLQAGQSMHEILDTLFLETGLNDDKLMIGFSV